ncbi:MAG TPA: sigma-70 family RNA polymerase sigma factor [Bacteroidia bacterium]|nr:sigma-70 family RNA polymerase sigma factor [Bacteroidia bacterium]
MTRKTILPPENELVAMLRSKNEQAIRVLYDHYSAALFGVVLRIVNDRETAEDLLQEVFVRIWNNAASYDVSRGRLYTWMLNIARNVSIDKLRSRDFRNHGQVRSLEDYVNTMENHQKEMNVDVIGLKKLVGKLKPEQQQLVDLLYFNGYTQTEAAEKLGIPLGTVKTRIKSALAALREIMQ